MKALFKSLSVTSHWLYRDATCSVIGLGENIAKAYHAIVIPHFKTIINPCKNLTQQNEKTLRRHPKCPLLTWQQN